MQALLDIGIHRLDHARNVRFASLQMLDDRRFPVQPVLAVSLDEAFHILAHRRAMRRPEDAEIHRLDLVERAHIVGHVAIGRGHDRRRPAHDVVTCQAGILFTQAEAEVVACVAGGLDHVERPARAGDDIAITDQHIRLEAEIVG